MLEAQYKAIEGVVSEDSYSEYYSSGSLYAYVSDSSSEEEQENPDDYKKVQRLFIEPSIDVFLLGRISPG